MNTNTEIKPWRSRVCGEPAGQLAVAAAADAEISDLRAEVARLQAALAERDTFRTVLEVLRNYPDFDDPESQFAKMIDEALDGKSPWLLEAMDCLAVGVKPPPQLERDAKQVQGELPPLPEPVDEIAAADGFNVLGCQDVFTADQMQAYARSAIAQRVGCGEPIGVIKEGRFSNRFEWASDAIADDSTLIGAAVYATAIPFVTDADKRDAERYRFLRKDSQMHYVSYRNKDMGFAFSQIRMRELDKYIDAAIAASEQANKREGV